MSKVSENSHRCYFIALLQLSYMHQGLKIYKITGKDKKYYVCRRYRDIWQKWKRAKKPYINYMIIEQEYRNGIWDSKTIANGDGWQEKIKGICALDTLWWQ